MDDDEGFSVHDRQAGASHGGGKQPEPHRPDGGSDDRLAQETDFSTFVLSLATTAQMGLGAVPHPETNQTALNLPAAKQMIDILSLLQGKTKGNLSEQESALLEQVLFNLRIHYVRTAEGQKKSGG